MLNTKHERLRVDLEHRIGTGSSYLVAGVGVCDG
jgi:hypothetical protein